MNSLARHQEHQWSTTRTRMRESLESLAAAVRRELPAVQFQVLESWNDVKPLHLTATYALPGRGDDQLVFSTMYTWHPGTLWRHCDLMQEDGPILLELPDLDLGDDPSEEALTTSVDEVVRFIQRCEQVIAERLGDQARQPGP